MNNNLIAQFEDQTGLTFDANGPEVAECEYCGKPFQYIPDHDCYGLRAASAEAARFEESAYGWGE